MQEFHFKKLITIPTKAGATNEKVLEIYCRGRPVEIFKTTVEAVEVPKTAYVAMGKML